METKQKHFRAGYYEINKVAMADWHLPVTVMAGNVIYNGLHWHDHLEIMACLQGSFSIRVEGEVYHLMPGDFLLINGGDSHEIFEGERNGLQLICSIDTGILKNAQEWYFFQTVGSRKDGHIHKDSPVAQHLLEVLGHMAYLVTDDIRLNREENWYEYHMYLYDLLLVLSGYKEKASAAGQKERKEEFRKCISFLNDHYSEDITIHTLAHQMGVSEPTMYRMFQKHLGMSFVTYLNMVRVRGACVLLEQPQNKVADIAFSCGFTSLSNFYRIFGEIMGMTPREYRKKQAQNTVNIAGGLLKQQSMMSLNTFQNFFELPYTREDLLTMSKTIEKTY